MIPKEIYDTQSCIWCISIFHTDRTYSYSAVHELSEFKVSAGFMCKCITRKICSGHSGLKPKSKERKKRANQNYIWTKGWQPRGRHPKNCREVPHSGEWGHRRFLLFSYPPRLTHKKSWWFYIQINYPKACYFSPLQLLPHCCKANHHLSSGSWQIILLSNLHTAARVSFLE